MEIRDKQGHVYRVEVLTKEFAEREWKQILGIGNRIPGIAWSKEYLVADKDEYREYKGKWEHSLIVTKGRPLTNDGTSGHSSSEVVAFLVAFEREPKGKIYKFPSFYTHLFAVKDSYQGKGIGKALLEMFFQKCKSGFRYLEGEPAVTLQVNIINQEAQGFYRRLGFRKIGRKIYPNRTDFVMVKK